MKQKILITGGLGYVGGRLAHYLSQYSDYQLILTTRQTVTDEFKEFSGKIIALDFTDEKVLETACKSIDCIIHLAAVNENVSAVDPVQALEVNGVGTLRLLRAAEKAGVKRFIYFSTAHVYGAPLTGMITEQTLPRPVHPYAITHHIAEDFVLAAKDKGSIEGIVLRLSNSFGHPILPSVDRWTLLVNDLARQAVVNKAMTLRSSGIQQRDFITLEDVSRAVLHFLQLSADKLDNGLFNLGGACALSVIEMVELLAERCEAVLGYKPAILKPEVSANEQAGRLDYRIDKLLATEFQLKKNMIAEIDNMLVFCKQHFLNQESRHGNLSTAG